MDKNLLRVSVTLTVACAKFHLGGTSASTPTFAGIISLINDYRLNNNLPPLGPINTRLVSLASSFWLNRQCWLFGNSTADDYWHRLYQIAEEHPGEAFYDITQGNR